MKCISQNKHMSKFKDYFRGQELMLAVCVLNSNYIKGATVNNTKSNYEELKAIGNWHRIEETISKSILSVRN